MTTITIGRFDERTDPRLGRHQVHDERSRRFAMELAPLPAHPVLHERHIPIFDQGSLGCCTAAAGLGMLATGPLWRAEDPVWGIADVHQLYHVETILDDRRIPGEWPPDDTGSAGLYLCKALQSAGLITSYWHAFSLRALLAKLAVQPCAIGIPWLQSMSTPVMRPWRDDVDARGRTAIVVDRSSAVAGGHEVVLDGIDPPAQLVRVCNSWGEGWGEGGRAWMHYDDLGWLLGQGGDAVTAVRTA